MIANSPIHIRQMSAIQLVLLSSLLIACSPDSAVNYQYGNVMPDGKFMVGFVEPLSRTEVYQRASLLMKEAQLTYPLGKHELSQEVYPTGKTEWIDTHSWYSTPADSPFTYHARITYLTEDDELSSVRLIFYYGGMNSLTESDWLQFKRWRDTYIPLAFPGSTITITRHPSVFTKPEDLARIQAAINLEE